MLKFGNKEAVTDSFKNTGKPYMDRHIKNIVVVNILLFILPLFLFVYSNMYIPEQYRKFDNSELLAIAVLMLVICVLIYKYHSCMFTKTEKTNMTYSRQLNQLESSNSLLETVLDSIPDMVTIFDTNWRYVYANKSKRDEMGNLGITEFLGKCAFDINPAARNSEFIKACAKVMESSEPKCLEQRLFRENRLDKWLETRIYKIEGGVLIIGTEITDKKRIETELAAKELAYKEIFNYANDSILLTEISGNSIRLVDVNEEASKVFGYTREEFLELSPEDLFQKSKTFYDRLKSILDRGILNDVLIYKHKDGTLITMEANARLIQRDGKTSILSILRDITERTDNLKKVMESEENFKRLFEASPEAIFVQSKAVPVLANSAALSLMGIKNIDEIEAATVDDLITIHPAYKNECSEMYASVVYNGNKHINKQIKLIKSDGSIFDAEMTILPFNYGGESAVQVIIRDVSERLRLEEAKREAEVSQRLLEEVREYDRLKTEFFSNISHELRTPLNIILASLQLHELYKRNNNLEAYNYEKHYKYMRQNCNRLLRLINNLIDITKIDSGFYELNLRNCNIIYIIEEITLSVADYIEENGILIQFDTDEEEKIIACDPDKIERIMLNLLSNSIKHTEAGGRIEVKVKSSVSHVQISVKDTGKGIPEDKLSSIFERFRQAERTLTRKSEGSGIGLALVKSLVEMHGGSVSVNSKEGVGTEFVINLPVLTCSSNDIIDYRSGANNVERIAVEFSDIYKIS